MALGDQAGKVAVDEINSTTLPEAAKLVSDSLTRVAVITNGLLNGIEGERLLAMQGLNDTLTATLTPLLAELAAWRVELAKITTFLSRLSLDKQA